MVLIHIIKTVPMSRRRFPLQSLPASVRVLVLVIAALLSMPAAVRADFLGHGGMVRALDVSPDGTRVLTASFDYTARVWDFVEQKELAVLDAHEGPVNAAAFLPDGARALTGGNDARVILWDVKTGKPIRRFTGHRNRVMAVAVSPDGTTAASGGWDRTVRLWDIATGTEIRVIAQPTPINTLVFHPDGRRLLSAGHDGTVYIWDVATGRHLGKLTGDELAVTRLAVSPDGGRVLSAGIDKSLRLWDLAAGKELRKLTRHEKQVYGVAFSPDGRTAISAGRDGFLIHWDLDRGTPIRVIRAHDKIIWAVAFTPDARFALTASSDESVRVWHLASGDRIGIPDEGDAAPKPWLVSDHPGARMFRKCARCHALSPDGTKRSGPHFAGLFGRRVGTIPDYNYSQSLRDADFVWDEKTLYALFHEGPDVLLPGTKMPVQRIPSDADLAALIDYLREITAPPVR